MKVQVELNVIRYKKSNINMTIQVYNCFVMVEYVRGRLQYLSISSPLRFHKISSICRRLLGNPLRKTGTHQGYCRQDEIHSYEELVSKDHLWCHTALGDTCIVHDPTCTPDWDCPVRV